MNCFGKFALQRTHRRTSGTGRCCVDQISHCFGLRQIELAIEKGTPTEFAGFGQAGAEVKATGKKHLHDNRPTMTLQFENVFAGERMGIREIEQQAAIDTAAISCHEIS
jgi:hypothetical protein